MISIASLRRVRQRRSLTKVIANGTTRAVCCSPRSIALAGALILTCLNGAYGQACPDPAPQTSGSHRFSYQGESISIPISVADCHPIALELRWSNSRNRGSLFKVTFWDSSDQPIFQKQVSGFMIGTSQFPFAALEPQPWLGSRSLISFPATVTIQAVRPFSFPASISYVITRVSRKTQPDPQNLDDVVATTIQPATEEGNVVVGIYSAVRLIGATRHRLVQIDMRTTRAFPARDTALQLQIGKRVFLNELSGDSSGRALTLTLTDAMFAELEDDAEIIAFFDKPDHGGFLGKDIWNFGRLRKVVSERKKS